ncbi:hypothetical protein Ocin01_05308 [Orchesella cincta]|uniref:Uncharacterized protein n=1 Tax=Orchesella cincta TaxID=48709 RepID=A0A1D2N8R0_ORCCI|nr:hypothetical protein Ocin01_05308 [Orchesella cincta]
MAASEIAVPLSEEYPTPCETVSTKSISWVQELPVLEDLAFLRLSWGYYAAAAAAAAAGGVQVQPFQAAHSTTANESGNQPPSLPHSRPAV